MQNRSNRRISRLVIVLMVALAAVPLTIFTASVVADPCGMVPPVYIGKIPIKRVGAQKTYLFYKDGIETMVIRPGFEGNVEEFGMLIPFPSVPSLRKAPDNIFPHLAAAIDPPEVVIDLRRRYFARGRRQLGANKQAKSDGGLELLEKEEVRVIKQEAIGMYEVAVLEAGSAAALDKWMSGHGYRYPKGMDKPCEDYVKAGWCFVAVKTKVGKKKGVDPKPGMRRVNSKIPDGSVFDGHVQAMGFRFRTDQLICPMRLSTFNEGDLRNIVYILSDKPQKIRSIPEEYVVRQIPGKDLFANVTSPLPLRIIGGKLKDIQAWQKQNLKQQRNPVPHNGSAKDLFAADLLSVKKNKLSHEHEETEKMYLRIGESLGLRGPDIDKLNNKAMEIERKEIEKKGLADLKSMTLTVVDGKFPRELLANQNLTFVSYTMPSRRNNSLHYEANQMGAGKKKQGIVTREIVSSVQTTPGTFQRIVQNADGGSVLAGLMLLSGAGLGFTYLRRGPFGSRRE